MTEEMKELLRAFARLSRMNLSVYNREFHSLFSSGDPSTSRVCNLLHQSPKGLELCIASDLSAKEACLRSKKIYAYRCPFGLFEAIVPLYVCGELNGFLMAGKSLPENGETATLASMESYMKAEDASLFREAIGHVTQHTDTEHEDLCRILQVLADQLSSMGGLPTGSENIAREIRKYLKRNLHLPLTLADLAINFHCSTVSLTKWYYREYEKTIMEDLLTFRMERAQELLRGTDRSVSFIAEACGYSDAGYFSKCFRRFTGMSPSRWRQTASSLL